MTLRDCMIAVLAFGVGVMVMDTAADIQKADRACLKPSVMPFVCEHYRLQHKPCPKGTRG